jgi:hypothetical protein
LIASGNASGVGLNVVAGDQYVAVVLPSRMFRNEFERRRLAPQALSRAVEDSGTVTSVLGPWNTRAADRFLPPVLLLQLPEPDPRCGLRLSRVQGAQGRRGAGGEEHNGAGRGTLIRSGLARRIRLLVGRSRRIAWRWHRAWQRDLPRQAEMPSSMRRTDRRFEQKAQTDRDRPRAARATQNQVSPTVACGFESRPRHRMGAGNNGRISSRTGYAQSWNRARRSLCGR